MSTAATTPATSPVLAPDVAVLGGGLAGLAAAAALGGAGFRVELFERRPFLGGRAASYEISATDSESSPDEPGGRPVIDNCQHVLLGCCTNLMDFYARLGVAGHIRFHDRIPFITPGGRSSVIAGDRRPAPLHLLASLRDFHALGRLDKAGIAAGMLALAFELEMIGRDRLDAQSMHHWLKAHLQTARAIEYFWRVVLTSALNEDLERVSAWHGLQVFWKGFIAARDAYRVGLPAVPLGDLYRLEIPGVRLHLRSAARSLETKDERVVSVCLGDGRRVSARWFVVALPFENTRELLPDAADYSRFEHSPIIGIHLWFDGPIFDRPMSEQPFAALLGRTIQWAFRKPTAGGNGQATGDAHYVQCVISAARAQVAASREELVDMAVRELAEFFPGRKPALRRSAVIKEVRATYSAATGLDHRRPAARTDLENCFLAGDWTATGWPPTMEGAVRSGYRAAEMIAAAAGAPRRFLQPDLEPEGIARWAPAARSRS